MPDMEELRGIVVSAMQVEAEMVPAQADSALMGSLPEFDSMSVVAILTAIEEAYDLVIDDDEISAEVFETLGSLHGFVQAKIGE